MRFAFASPNAPVAPPMRPSRRIPASPARPRTQPRLLLALRRTTQPSS